MANSSLEQSQKNDNSDPQSAFSKRESTYAPNAEPMSPEKISEMNMIGEGAPPKISRDLVAARAHEIWVESGKLPGRDEQNWLQAEEDLRTRTTRHEF